MMKYFLAVCVLFFVITCNAFAQQGKYLKHTVSKGETIIQIAQKYKVTPADIYKLNPDSQKGVQLNMVLLIPVASPKATAKPFSSTKSKTHQVQPKETWFSIAKLCNLSVEDLKQANSIPSKEGLKTGINLVVPTKSEIKKPEIKSDKPVYHEVLPKETKFAIAKKYNLTVAQLEKQNPEIISDLPIGYQLLISGKAPKSVAFKNTIVPTVKAEKNKVTECIPYEIKAKQTLYGLTKMFGMTAAQLTALNPELANGVKEGLILKIPATVSITDTIKKDFADLSKTVKTDKLKELVLLLPFNISKLESDTINSTAARLKKDKFLNMTLDFYSGALMAIDSAKTLGLNINVNILDSQEVKNASNITALVQRHNLENVDAIIGPFYQANAEKTAELVKKNNVPVISPLSKDKGNSFSNLYQSMPPSKLVRKAMFDYMRSKDGNVVAVIAAKKAAIKQYISESQRDVKLVGFGEKGIFVADSLKKLLVKDKMNFVIMESEKTQTIFSITDAMLALMTDYQLQLVILEPNPTLDFEEIELSRLTKLKLLYPSLIRENETPEALLFENAYKNKNKVFPSQYATRGFDITFDTMLRLSQEKSFEETIQTIATAQVENKFDYQKVSEGYDNKGVYILYYDTDLTIKEAN